jgi:hypothetical protein
MNRLSFNWRDISFSALIFLSTLFIFVVLGSIAAWPSEREDWRLAVIIAASAAMLPIVARVLTFMQRSGGSLKSPLLGLELSFATVGTDTKTFSQPIIQQGNVQTESGQEELEQSAQDARRHSTIVVDLEDGRAWYLTRLFALAATAVLLGAPQVIVLIGQRGGNSKQVGGWIRPQDFVTALRRQDQRFDWIWRHARSYLLRLQSEIFDNTNHIRISNYIHPYQNFGDAVIMRILIDQMRQPDSLGGAAQISALEEANDPPWVTLSSLMQKLDLWLKTDSIDLDEPDKKRLLAILACDSDIVIATKGGQFAGVIDVHASERKVLRDLVQHTEAPSTSG